MGFKFHNNQWMDDKEYNSTKRYEEHKALLFLAWSLVIFVFGFLAYLIFDSYKVAFLSSFVSFIGCFFISNILQVIADWIKKVLQWVLILGSILIIGIIIYSIFTVIMKY